MALSKIKGKFILTINNHKDIVELYTNFCIRKVCVQYTIGQLAKSKVTELVIANFKLPQKLW